MRMSAQDYESLRRDKILLDALDKENTWTARSDETGRIMLEQSQDGKGFREAVIEALELSHT